MSHGGNLVERESRKRRWCLLASLLAAWTSTSQLAHKAASSEQHISVAGAFSHTSHCIFILKIRGTYKRKEALSAFCVSSLRAKKEKQFWLVFKLRREWLVGREEDKEVLWFCVSKEPTSLLLTAGPCSRRLHSSSGSAAHVASFLLCLFHLTLSTEKERLLFFFFCV